MPDLAGLVERARALFRARFGGEPLLFTAAPGRVNLIGEHTDYNEGFVFPAAIDRHVVVAASPAPDASKVWSESYQEPAVFDAARESPMHGWARFPSGAAWTLARSGHPPTNLNAAVVSDLPRGAGVSSSAAMELAFLTLWNALDGFRIDPMGLAVLGQRTEHEFVGVQCGLMDQMASALGRAGCGMLIDTRSMEVSYRAIPPTLQIVICGTNKQRSLDVSAYNQRRRECEEAARDMGVSSLRDATLSMLDGTFPGVRTVKAKRARHVLKENERCVQFAEALEKGDFERIGGLMKASHESLRDDYEVSCHELDWMAESAWTAQGCVGARMTGAGFGGSCVALVEAGKVRGFFQETERAYMGRSGGLEPTFFACIATDGAHRI